MEKGKEKIHVEVEPFTDGSDSLKAPKEEASDDVNQPFNFYTKGPYLQMLTPTISLRVIGRKGRSNLDKRFGYANLISYALTVAEEIDSSE